jgi:colanic acid/amylovoran biosynthesis glycosyltransferase
MSRDSNKTNKELLFVTYQYPFLPQEYFIEEEIGYLANAFERVVVFPARCLWWRSKLPPREMPDGVELWDPQTIPRFQRLMWSASALLPAFSLVRRQYAGWSGSAEMPNVGLVQALATAYKTLVTGRALEWFTKKRRRGQREVVGYAYWRETGAGALALNRDELGLSRLHVRCHRGDIYLPQRWPNETTIHERADGIYPVSTDGLRYLVDTKGFAPDNLMVQRLGVNLPVMLSSPSADGILRIVSCSNVVPVKRVEFIAEVVAKLPFRTEWTHIGDGPEADFDQVRQIAKAFDGEHVAVFKGRLSNAEVLQYYKDNPVDSFINLSESEGVPVSIMEALAHGIPVLATDVGGTGEVMTLNTGRLFSVDASVDAVVSQIEGFVNDSGFRTVARDSAREMAEGRCDSNRNYSNFCRVLLAD